MSYRAFFFNFSEKPLIFETDPEKTRKNMKIPSHLIFRGWFGKARLRIDPHFFECFLGSKKRLKKVKILIFTYFWPCRLQNWFRACSKYGQTHVLCIHIFKIGPLNWRRWPQKPWFLLIFTHFDFVWQLATQNLPIHAHQNTWFSKEFHCV